MPKLSVIIPALNAAESLGATVAALEEARACDLAVECLVIDGGSKDTTVTIARGYGADVSQAAPGRGAQLLAGAARAKGSWLLFLHADTRLEAGWAKEVTRFIADPRNERRAAVFRFALDDGSTPARRLERIVAWRCRALGLPYGDQGLLIGHHFYREIGGFRPLPLMEDVDIIRRIRREHLVLLETRAITSARRYLRDGWLLRSLRNLSCLALYFLGLPPRLIRRFYA